MWWHVSEDILRWLRKTLCRTVLIQICTDREFSATFLSWEIFVAIIMLSHRFLLLNLSILPDSQRYLSITNTIVGLQCWSKVSLILGYANGENNGISFKFLSCAIICTFIFSNLIYFFIIFFEPIFSKTLFENFSYEFFLNISTFLVKI